MPQQFRKSAPERDGQANGDSRRREDGRATEAPTELLDLLGDEYARTAIDAIREQPRTGAEVAAATEMSKPTAFRRLNDLEDLGLVEVRRRIDTDHGHHSKVYEFVADSLSVDFGTEDVRVSVETSGTPRDRDASPYRPREFAAGGDGDSAPARVVVSD